MKSIDFRPHLIGPFLFALCCVFLLTLGTAVQAQGNYKLGPGDVLSIKIERHPDWSDDQQTVTPAGMISLPVVGDVKVTGKTTSQVEAILRKRYAVRIHHPRVTVALRQASEKLVFVAGTGVQKPGSYPMKPGWRVSEALTVAGGLTGPASLTSAVITRDKNQTIKLDLESIIKNKNSPANRVLEPGDNLTIEERTIRIRVAGALTQPGALSLPLGSTVLRAIDFAGGATDRAALTKANIQRADGSVVRVNLFKLLKEGDLSANLPLRDGDVLTIPENQSNFSVSGQVAKPGFYSIPDGRALRIAEAVMLAGNYNSNAALSKTIVQRANGTSVRVDLRKVLIEGDNEQNIVIRAGDVISLPEANERVTVQGQVGNPGIVEIKDGSTMTASKAVSLAGGYTRGSAALSKTTVKRDDGTLVTVDLNKVLVQRDPKADIELKSGDVVTVPELDTRVAVLGAVSQPGFQTIPDASTLRVSEAVAQAGSYSSKAALTRAQLRRVSGEVLPINLYRVLVDGSPEGDIQLQPYDVLAIPEARGVTILGAVNRPETYFIEQGMNPRLSDILARAGSLASNTQPADVTISVLRTAPDGKQELLPVDAVGLLNNKDQSQNIELEDGDLVTVSPVERRTVFISGEVLRPGPYELQENESVLELITRAGGVTPLAALQRINVTERNGTTKTVNVQPALRDGRPMKTEPLKAGSLVVVPENKRRVLVLQAVSRPGYYPIPENEELTIGEALAAAGPSPNVKEVAVIRQTGQSKPQQIAYKLNQVYEGKMATDIPLRHGDVLFVPDPSQKTGIIGQIQKVLGPLGFLSAILGG